MGQTLLITSNEQINASYMRYYHLRINRGMTDQDVAKTLHIGLNAFINWRTGKAIPSIKNLYKLAQYFDTQVSYITDGVSLNADGIAT